MGEEIELQVARVRGPDALLEDAARPRGRGRADRRGRRARRPDPVRDGESERACEELLARMETLVADTGLPLVPQRGDGFVFLRPPGD